MAVIVVLAQAADDLIASRLGTRPARWHARRLAHLARSVYLHAVYGTPSDSREVELHIYDVEIMEDPR